VASGLHWAPPLANLAGRGPGYERIPMTVSPPGINVRAFGGPWAPSRARLHRSGAVCLLIVGLTLPGLGAGVAAGQGSSVRHIEGRPVLAGGPTRALVWRSANGLTGARVRAAVPPEMPPSRLGPETGGHDGQPAVAARPDGSVWVMASRSDGAPRRLWAQSFQNGRWSRAEHGPAAGTDDRHPALGAGGKALWAVWIASDGARTGARSALYASRRQGDGWTPPERLPQPRGEPMAPAIAVDDRGLATVVWAADGDGHAEIWVSWRGPTGWSTPLALTSDDTPDATPSIAVSGDRWLIAWSSFGPRAYWTEAVAGQPGRRWEAPRRISRHVGSSPLALAAQGQLAVVWVVPESVPGSTRSVLRWSQRSGDSWQLPRDMALSVNADIGAAVGADGRLRLGWTNLRGSLTVGESDGPFYRERAGDLRVVLGRPEDAAAPGSFPPPATPRLTSASRWLAFGDSITEGYTIIGGKPVIVGGYPSTLQARLGGGAQVINSGKGGENTISGVGRFGGALGAAGANGAVIMEGTNDVSQGISASVSSFNLRQMAATAKAAGVTTLLAEVLPRDEQGFGGSDNAATNALNGQLPGAAAAAGASMAFTHGPFVGRGDLFATHTHPTSGGYSFLGGVIFTHINKLPEGGGGDPCALALNPLSAHFAPAGGNGSVALTTGAGCNWAVTSNATWITLDDTARAVAAAFTGSDTVAYEVATNATTQARAGTLAIGNVLFTVTQEAPKCIFSIAPASQSVLATGGAHELEVTTEAACKWTASSNATWLRVTAGSSGTGSGKVRYQVDANGAGIARAGTLLVAGSGFKVSQAAAPCTFAASVISQGFPPEGGASKFNVATLVGCVWVAESSSKWVQIMDNARTGDGRVRYSVESSNKKGRRRAKIRFGDIGHQIVQLGAAAADYPAPPKRLELQVMSPQAVRLRWKDKARNETGYMLATADTVYTLARNRVMYLDEGAIPGAINCYTLQAFNDAGLSGPVKACVTTPASRTTASPSTARAANLPVGPQYVTGPVGRVAVGADAGTLPTLPTARIYKAYEPWGQRGVEEALEARGYVRGESLFVHPVQDLAAGIPVGTAVVLIPSASDGDRLGQVSAVNAAPAQRALSRFVRTGGYLVQHRWSERRAAYRVPVDDAPSRRLGGYDVLERGGGAVYVTYKAVDHPAAGPLARLLDRMLDRLLP